MCVTFAGSASKSTTEKRDKEGEGKYQQIAGLIMASLEWVLIRKGERRRRETSTTMAVCSWLPSSHGQNWTEGKEREIFRAPILLYSFLLFFLLLLLLPPV